MQPGNGERMASRIVPSIRPERRVTWTKEARVKEPELRKKPPAPSAKTRENSFSQAIQSFVRLKSPKERDRMA
jgi:hypothetical protein